MKRRIIPRQTILWLILTICHWGLSGCEKPIPRNNPIAEIPNGATIVVPANGALIGAYIDFGETEDHVFLENIEHFEEMAGKHQAIIASSSFWGQGSFPLKNVLLIARHGALPLIYWLPWDRPYTENRGPDRFGLHQILAGQWDGYIDTWADAARSYDRPLLVAFGIEMNGTWFPWSGCFYDKTKKTSGPRGSRHPGPELYKRAYRHVVDRVRRRGAHRIQWVFHANNQSFPAAPWNDIGKYYPGSKYADWLGLSAYGMQFQGEPWESFPTIMVGAYQELCRLDPNKPVIVAEWGVGEFPSAGSKADWLREAFQAFKTQYPRVKAAVYWHERWQNEDDTYSNLRISSSPEALEAFRAGLADEYWLDRPPLAFGPRPPP